VQSDRIYMFVGIVGLSRVRARLGHRACKMVEFLDRNTYNLFDTYYNLYLTFYFNTLKIHHSTLSLSADTVRFWVFIFYKVM